MLGYTNVYAPVLNVHDHVGNCCGSIWILPRSKLGIEMVRGMRRNHQVAATGKSYSNNKKGAGKVMTTCRFTMFTRSGNDTCLPLKRVMKGSGTIGR